jgi:hypothetical protein
MPAPYAARGMCRRRESGQRMGAPLRSLASRRRCEASPPKAAQPCARPPSTPATPPAAAASSSVWARGRPPSVIHVMGRSDRAATRWSTSMSVPATTAVNTGPRPSVRTSGAATAPASKPCANGSEHDRTRLGIVIEGVVVDGAGRDHHRPADPRVSTMRGADRVVVRMLGRRRAGHTAEPRTATTRSSRPTPSAPSDLAAKRLGVGLGSGSADALR